MGEPAVQSGPIIDRIAALMRRDLKLGDVAIAADTPLLGGDFDLDSLDVLLLVTSIEKEFGIKIADGAIGREAFKDVATLASFVEKAQGGPGARGNGS
jgi:3-hydroxyacyl-[acyl-carrier-protein] dehydratase